MGNNDLNPENILKESIKHVPSLKYAYGIVGIAAAIAIVVGLLKDTKIAIFGPIIMLALMTVLVVFAKLTKASKKTFQIPIKVLIWFSLVLTMTTAVLLFTSAFFRWPMNLQVFILPDTPSKDVISLAYTGAPPIPTKQFANPKLGFDILSKRKGEIDFSPLKDGDALASEVDDYQIVAHPLTNGYLYIYQEDTSGKIDWLFPEKQSSKYSSGSNPVTPGQTFNRVFFLDRNEGIEHIYVTFSATPWTALEDAITMQTASFVQHQGARLTARVQKPNGLKMRGVGGIRDDTIPVNVNGKQVQLPIHESSSACMTIERWFKHINP